MLAIEDYLAMRGMHPDPRKSHVGHDRLWYHCPFHSPDHDPSFYVSREKNLWRCPVCQEGGTVMRLVARVEFEGREDRATWREVYRRVEELEGGALPTESAPRETSPRVGRSPVVLGEEECELLSEVTTWWHVRLFDQTRGARAARAYLTARGVSCAAMRCRQVGYAPRDPDGSYADALCAFFQQKKRGARQEDALLQLGIFTTRKDGRTVLRHQTRVMFSAEDEEGYTRFFQGRVVGEGGGGGGGGEAAHQQGRSTTTTTRYKYLGAPLPKYPFSLAVEDPLIEGTVCTESPMGPLVLYGYGISGMATCGTGGLSEYVLSRFARPLYWAQDNDEPKVCRSGGTTHLLFPGEEQARRALEQCRMLGIEAYRLLPPPLYKGLDEWCAAEGVCSLLAGIRACRGEERKEGQEMVDGGEGGGGEDPCQTCEEVVAF